MKVKTGVKAGGDPGYPQYQNKGEYCPNYPCTP